MNIAEGSLEEGRYYLFPAQELGYGPTDLLMNSLAEVSRQLNAWPALFMKVRSERVQQAEITGSHRDARQIGLIHARSRSFMNNAG